MKKWLKERLKAKEIGLTLISLMPSSLYLEMRWRIYNLLQSKEELECTQSKRKLITEWWSFKPFDDTRSIFVHIPKCAGDSISRTLYGNLSGGHLTLDQYLNVFEPKCINNYFKFAIVRNPWDRLVSAYYYLKNGGFNEEHRNWFCDELGHFKDFDEFVRGWLNRSNIEKWEHFRPQYQYIVERRGKVRLDFTGYFENLQDDFKYIRERLGIDCQLHHSNKSTHNDYKDYYSEETKRIVAEVYSADIKLLGYNFDNSNMMEQLTKRNSACSKQNAAFDRHKLSDLL